MTSVFTSNKNIFCLLLSTSLIIGLTTLSFTAVSKEKTEKIPYIEFKQTKVQDAVGLIAEIADINIAVTQEASQTEVSFRMKDTSAEGIIDTLARVTGLWYRYMRSTNSYLIMTTAQYQSDIVVFRDDLVKTFELRHQNVEAAAKTIRNLYGERVVLTLEYKNDDFEGLPFENVEEAIVSGAIGTMEDSSNNSSTNNYSNNSTNNNSNNNSRYNNNSNQNSQNNDKQNTSRGENGTVSGEQISTLGNFAQDRRKQNLLTSGQLSSLQGQQNVQDQKVAKVTDTQTPIYITINRIHNLLFVRTTDEGALSEISALIKVSDKPTPQVLFEMEIIEINVTDSFDQDFDLGFSTAGQVDNFNISSSSDTAANTAPELITTDNFTVDLSESTEANYALQLAAILNGENVSSLAASASGGIYNFINDQVNAQITLLKENGQARTLSKPVLLASNNRQAKIFIGDEQIIATGMETSDTETTYDNNGNAITSAGTTQVETERRKIGNTLYLMPSINADRTITIDILQDKSQVVSNGANLPYFDEDAQEIKTQNIDSVNQANVKTVVIAKDGLTVALGGMVSSSTSLQTSEVPVLSDIPFIGTFFTSEYEVNNSYQYIMLITPHIIMTPEETAEQSRKVSGFNYRKNADYNGESPYPDYGFDRYIELTKFAIDTINNETIADDFAFNNNIKSISDLSGSAAVIFPIHGVSAKAKAAWQQDDLYITAFNVRNHTPIEQIINSNKLHGKWLSATIVNETLSPFSEEGDSTWLYLVSDQPFQEIANDIRQ